MNYKFDRHNYVERMGMVRHTLESNLHCRICVVSSESLWWHEFCLLVFCGLVLCFIWAGLW